MFFNYAGTVFYYRILNLFQVKHTFPFRCIMVVTLLFYKNCNVLTMAEQSTLEYIILRPYNTGVLYGNVLLYSESNRLHDGRRPTDWGRAVPQKAIYTMASFCYRYQNASVSCFLVHIRAFVVLNLAGIAKFKYERKNKMDSGSSEMTASCKWPILFLFLFEEKVYSVFDRCVFIGINFWIKCVVPFLLQNSKRR